MIIKYENLGLIKLKNTYKKEVEFNREALSKFQNDVANHQ